MEVSVTGLGLICLEPALKSALQGGCSGECAAGLVTIASALSAGVSQGLSASDPSSVPCGPYPQCSSQHTGSGNLSRIGVVVVTLELKFHAGGSLKVLPKWQCVLLRITD